MELCVGWIDDAVAPERTEPEPRPLSLRVLEEFLKQTTGWIWLLPIIKVSRGQRGLYVPLDTPGGLFGQKTHTEASARASLRAAFFFPVAKETPTYRLADKKSHTTTITTRSSKGPYCYTLFYGGTF